MSRTARYSFIGTRGLRPRGVTVYFRTDLVGTLERLLRTPGAWRSRFGRARSAPRKMQGTDQKYTRQQTVSEHQQRIGRYLLRCRRQ